MNKKFLVTAISIGTLALAGVTIANASTLFTQKQNQNSALESTNKPMGMMLGRQDGLAEFLNMSEEDFHTALQVAMKTDIEEIAMSQGKTIDELNTFLNTRTQEQETRHEEMQTKLKESLDKKIASGEITQAQADEMLTRPGMYVNKGTGMGRGKMGSGFHKNNQNSLNGNTETTDNN